MNALANVLEVSPLALKIPDIDSDLGFIHTLFAIEDIHGARAERQGDEVHIIFDGCKRNMDASVYEMLSAWAEQSEKVRSAKSSTTIGVTRSPQRTPHKSGEKYPRRNLAMHS